MVEGFGLISGISVFILMAAGLAVCFAGYRFFRLSITLIGGALGFFLGKFVFEHFASVFGLEGNETARWITVGVFTVALGGAAFALYLKAIVAVATLGVGFWFSSSYGAKEPKEILISWLIGLGIGLAVGLTVYYVQKWAIIIATAASGAKLFSTQAVPLIITFEPVRTIFSRLGELLFPGQNVATFVMASGLIVVVLMTAGIVVQAQKD
ncbi:MAG: DUF4203 domain-containing protein [Clostridiales bacterium]|nr:DUF4203 domain-containing protein [Clostridiales bacterium]